MTDTAPPSTELDELIARIERENDPGERAALLVALADRLETRFGDPERALVARCEALACAPLDPGLGAAIERLAAATGRHDLAADAAEGALAGATAGDLGDAWARLARWSARAGRWERAVNAAHAALAETPGHPLARAALEEGLRALGHDAALAEALSARAHDIRAGRAAGAAADALALHLELAAVHDERLDDPAQAIAACENALRLDATSRAALDRLERLARRTRRLPLLVDTLDRKLGLPLGPAERRETALALADAWEAMGRAEDAVRTLTWLIERADPDVTLLGELARVAAKAGRLELQAAALERQRDLLDDPILRAERACALADVLCRLGRPADAEACLTRALADAPAHGPARAALVRLLRARGDHAAVVDACLAAAQFLPDPEARAAALVDAAIVTRDRLNDDARARELLAWARDLAPHEPRAAARLLDLAVADQDHARVVALTSELLEHAPMAPPDRRAFWCALRAGAREATGARAEALEDRRRACALCPGDLDYLQALARAAHEAGDLGEAAETLERLVADGTRALAPGVRARALLRLSDVRTALGDVARARAAATEALEADPGFTPALAALARLLEQTGALAHAAAVQVRLVRQTHEPEQHRDRAVALARLLRERLGKPGAALKAIDEALTRDPGAWPLLLEKIDAHVALGQWRGAVDALLALGRACDGRDRARCLAAAAHVLEARLDEGPRAVALYEEALALDPLDVASFRRAWRVRARQGAWRDQERSTRRAIQRLAGDGDERARALVKTLWQALGQVYREKLGDPSSAALAHEVAVRLAPGDDAAAEALCAAYEAIGAPAYQRACAERRRLIERAPHLGDVARQVRALGHLAVRERDPALAAGAAETLVALGVATPAETRLAERSAAPWLAPRACLRDEDWPLLCHADEDARVTAVMAEVGRALIVRRSRRPRAWGLRVPDPVERMEIERSLLGRLLIDTTAALRMPRPDLMFRPDLPGTLQLVPVRYRGRTLPTFVAGADMLQVRSRLELIWLLSTRLALAREDRLALWPLVADGPQRLQAEAARVPGAQVDTPAIQRWTRAVVLGASRVGLAFTADLHTALSLGGCDGAGGISVPRFDQLRDLVSFRLSPAYRTVRAQLTGVPAAAPAPPVAAEARRSAA